MIFIFSHHLIFLLPMRSLGLTGKLSQRAISQNVSKVLAQSVPTWEIWDYPATWHSNGSSLPQCLTVPKVPTYSWRAGTRSPWRNRPTRANPLSECLRIATQNKKKSTLLYSSLSTFSFCCSFISYQKMPFLSAYYCIDIVQSAGEQPEHSWELISDGLNQLISMLSVLSESQNGNTLGSNSSCSWCISSSLLLCGVSDSWLLYTMLAYRLIKKDLSGWAHDDWGIPSPLARFEYLTSSLMLLLFLFVRRDWKMKEGICFAALDEKLVHLFLKLSKGVKPYSDLHQRATYNPSAK